MYDESRDIPSVPGTKRTYTPEEAGNGKYRKPVSRFRRRKRKPVNVGVVILAAVFCVIVGVCVYILTSGGGRESLVAAEPDSTVEESVTTAPEEIPAQLTLTLSEEQIYTGDLILVNYAYPYKFPKAELDEIQTVISAKNKHYLARDNSISLRLPVIQVFNRLMEDFDNATGCSAMQVNSAFRSYDEQVAIYEDYKERNGEEYAKAYVANPGYSEHHTGLALDLNVYIKGEGVYYVESYPACQWFRDNCTSYGFILRYPQDKVYITSINHESWHYRYVGTPHADIMKQLNLCLEEYIDYLKSYSSDNALLYVDGTIGRLTDAESFTRGNAVYYVASRGETTEIKVPRDADCKVSGNNVDGYIITLTKQ